MTNHANQPDSTQARASRRRGVWPFLLLAYWIVLAATAALALDAGSTLFVLPVLVAGIPLYVFAAHAIGRTRGPSKAAGAESQPSVADIVPFRREHSPYPLKQTSRGTQPPDLRKAG